MLRMTMTDHDLGLRATVDRLLRRDLGIPLDAWLLDLVDDDRSAAWIARHLVDVTDGVASVSRQTVARWIREAREAEEGAV